MRDRRYLFVLPLAAFLTVLRLVLRGDSCGHDFEFHIFNWMEVGSQWRQGILLPHWEFTSAWNSGEPRFIFYPPISWALGALLGLILPWAAVPIALIWIALTACALSMYKLAHEWSSEGIALIAACLYLVHPYMLFTFFERSAYAELIAAAWMPLVVLGVLRERLTVAGIAIPVALLWLSNDPGAVMGCYTIALLGAIRVAWSYRKTRRVRPAAADFAKLATGAALGIALAAFSLLPAIVEQHWVQIRMIMIRGVRVEDNFLFDQSMGPGHRGVVHTASVASIWLLAAIALFGAIALIAALRCTQPNFANPALAALLLAAAIIAFLLTPWSLPIWTYAPELKYLQFPWRFNAVLGAIAVALFALACRRIRIPISLAIFVGLAITLLGGAVGYKQYRQWCNRGNDTASLANDFYRGAKYDDTDSYLPAGADHYAMGHANPESWIASDPQAPAPPDALRRYSVALKDRLHFEVSSPSAAYLVLNLRDYPAWRIVVNGATVNDYPHRPDGLIVLPIPQGTSKIDIADAVTWDRIAGWPISALALMLLIAVHIRERRRVAATS